MLHYDDYYYSSPEYLDGDKGSYRWILSSIGWIYFKLNIENVEKDVDIIRKLGRELVIMILQINVKSLKI